MHARNHSLARTLVTGPNATSTRHSLDRYGPNGSPVISVLEGIRAAVSPSIEGRFKVSR